MSGWLDPVRATLDQAQTVNIFFRDDDIGWNDERLFRLLDVLTRYEMPIDLAVIPTAATPRLARALLPLTWSNSAAMVALHQHGYSHHNHEPNGRKAEFGASRPLESQRRDIDDGRSRLHDLFGSVVQPIFTPPWNRCRSETGLVLAACGFRILSRDSGAVPLGVPALRELPIRIDWFARHHGERLPRPVWAERCANAIAQPGATGILLHHALMDASERGVFAELVALLARHRGVRPQTMITLAGLTASQECER